MQKQRKTAKAVHEVLAHLTVILSLMFLVFVILDQFNPLMNFVNNGISTVLLVLLCLCALSQSVWHYVETERKGGGGA